VCQKKKKKKERKARLNKAWLKGRDFKENSIVWVELDPFFEPDFVIFELFFQRTKDPEVSNTEVKLTRTKTKLSAGVN